jgi:hypothetical protein
VSTGNIFGLSDNAEGGILAGLGGAAGAFPTPTSTSGTTTGNSTTNSSSNIQSLLNTLSTIQGQQNQNTTAQQNQTTTSGYATPGATNLSNSLANAYSQISQPVNLSPYEAQQTANINTAQQAALAARGLATSPVSGAVEANTQQARVGQITNLQQQIPLLQQQMNLQNLGAGSNYLATAAPKTSTTAGTSGQQVAGTTTQTGNTSQTGNTTQTGQQNTQSTQQTQQQQKSGGGIGGFLGGLGGVLASLF